MKKTAMTQLRDKLLEEIHKLKVPSQQNLHLRGYREALINVANDIDAQMLRIESEMINQYKSDIEGLEEHVQFLHDRLDSKNKLL